MSRNSGRTRFLTSWLVPRARRAGLGLLLAGMGLLSTALAQWTEPALFGVEHGNAIRGPWISNDALRMYVAFSGGIVGIMFGIPFISPLSL